MTAYLPIIISAIIIFTALMWWLLALGGVKKDSDATPHPAPPKAVPAPPVAAAPPPAATKAASPAKLMADPKPASKSAPPKAQAPLKAAATKAAPVKAAKPAAKLAVAPKVAAPKPVLAKPAAPKPQVVPVPKAKVPAKASIPDNLELLKGVGPKVNNLLRSMGVTSFDQVANWTPTDITEIDSKLGAFAGRIGRDNWVDQAKLLVAGDVAGFEKKYGALGSETKG